MSLGKHDVQVFGYIANETIVGFTVANANSVVGQTRQNLQRMFEKNRDFEAR